MMYFVLTLIALVLFCGAAQTVLAFARTDSTKADDLGPISWDFPFTIESVHEALAYTIKNTRGVRLRTSTPDRLLIDVRPSLGRLDDGMGLFATIVLSQSSTATTYMNSAHAKSWFQTSDRSRLALVAFDRELRNQLRQIGFVPNP